MSTKAIVTSVLTVFFFATKLIAEDSGQIVVWKVDLCGVADERWPFLDADPFTGDALEKRAAPAKLPLIARGDSVVFVAARKVVVDIDAEHAMAISSLADYIGKNGVVPTANEVTDDQRKDLTSANSHWVIRIGARYFCLSDYRNAQNKTTYGAIAQMLATLVYHNRLYFLSEVCISDPPPKHASGELFAAKWLGPLIAKLTACSNPDPRKGMEPPPQLLIPTNSERKKRGEQ